MYPPGMGREEANNLLKVMKQQAILHFKDKPHDGNDIRKFIDQEWAKACQVEYKPPPEQVKIALPEGGSVEIPGFVKKTTKSEIAPTAGKGEWKQDKASTIIHNPEDTETGLPGMGRIG